MEEEKTKKQKFYIENYPVLNVEDGLEKGWKRVTIKDSQGDLTVDMPKWEFDAVVDREPSDASDARNRRAIFIVDKIYELLSEYNVRSKEIGFYLQKLLAKLEGQEIQAINRAFEVDNEFEIRVKHWEEPKQ